jgi:hypothetical protein
MPIMTVIAAGHGIASPRLLEGNLMTLRGDVKKGHAINGLSLFGNPSSAYNYCKEGLDKKYILSIFSLA